MNGKERALFYRQVDRERGGRERKNGMHDFLRINETELPVDGEKKRTDENEENRWKPMLERARK